MRIHNEETCSGEFKYLKRNRRKLRVKLKKMDLVEKKISTKKDGNDLSRRFLENLWMGIASNVQAQRAHKRRYNILNGRLF